MGCKNKHCKCSDNVSKKLENLIANVIFEEEVFQYSDECDEGNECKYTRKNSCNSCKRDESLRYCGRSFPSIGVYNGDQYDDVIESILEYLVNGEQ